MVHDFKLCFSLIIGLCEQSKAPLLMGEYLHRPHLLRWLSQERLDNLPLLFPTIFLLPRTLSTPAGLSPVAPVARIVACAPHQAPTTSPINCEKGVAYTGGGGGGSTVLVNKQGSVTKIMNFVNEHISKKT